jgi:hypothetical protein
MAPVLTVIQFALAVVVNEQPWMSVPLVMVTMKLPVEVAAPVLVAVGFKL